MKKNLLFLLSFYSTFSCLAQVDIIKESKAIQALPAAPVISGTICNKPSKVWDKVYGGSGKDGIRVILPTKEGGFLLVGASVSGISGDKTEPTQGDTDFWVVKTDANGTKIWDKSYSGDSKELIVCAIQCTDGGYFLGGATYPDTSEPSNRFGNFWLVKIDDNGNKLWDKRYGQDNFELLNSILPTNDGGYMLLGYKTPPNEDKSDYWLVKIDTNGNQLWDKFYGGNKSDQPTSVVQTNDVGYLLCGYSDSDVSRDKTQPSWGDGYYWTERSDYWIVKIDAYGNKMWDKRYGGNYFEHLSSVVVTADGGFLLGGLSLSDISGDKAQNSQGMSDYWLVKIDANGNKLWDKRYGGNKNDLLEVILQSNDGGYLLAGTTDSDISGDKTEDSKGEQDYWIVKIDANGNKLWDKIYGGDNYDILSSAIATADESYLLGGYSKSGISGDKTLASKGDDDFWLIKISSCQPVTNFCEGNTYTLSATNCAGIVTWSTGAVVNSIEVSAAGTYTATCTINNETSPVSNSIVVTPATATLSGTATNGTGKAINTITSTQTIPSGVKTTYQAGKSISLQGTFQAQTGSVFKAEIKGCE